MVAIGHSDGTGYWMLFQPYPAQEGNALLASLAREHKDIAYRHTWLRAFLNRDAPDAVLLYVDLVIEQIFGEAENYYVGRQLAEYVQKHPELKPELKRRYEAAGNGPCRKMLEHFFSEAGDEDDLIAMVKKYAANGQSYDGLMARAVEAVALDHVPVAGSSNVFNIYPASVGNLRKKLFGFLGGSPAKAALAQKCLEAIDCARDEYGIAANDARHPDVLAERPWPPEAVP